MRARLRVTGRDGQAFFKNISVSIIHPPVVDCPPVQMVHGGPGTRQNVTCFVWCHPPIGKDNVTWSLIKDQSVKRFQVSVKKSEVCSSVDVFSFAVRSFGLKFVFPFAVRSFGQRPRYGTLPRRVLFL